MTQDLISDGERKFIIDGIRTNIRLDGRQRLDVESFCIEWNVLPYCVCSARVSLHSTTVIVGLKLEVDAPDPEQPARGKIECSVRHSPSAAHWKKNHELESMNFDLSRELQNIMANCNGIDLKELCIIPNRLCWLLYVDVVVIEHRGNVFDATCLAVNACFKILEIPNLNIKNAEQFEEAENQQHSKEDEDGDNEMEMERKHNVDTLGLFQNTEITKKATISKMRMQHRQRASKFSGDQMPFQSSMAMEETKQNRTVQPVESRDIAEIEFDIERGRGQRLNGREMLPIVVTMAIMDESRYFIVDPLYEEELCCDLLIRIAVYSNGQISVIKYGENAIDPLLVFGMIESGKQSGTQWMRQMEDYLNEEMLQSDGARASQVTKDGNESKNELDLMKISTFSMDKKEEKTVEEEMRQRLKALSFVTESLRKDSGPDFNGSDKAEIDSTAICKDNDTLKRKDSGSSVPSSNDDEDMIIID